MKVEDLMTTDVRVCGPEETLQVAARLMWDHDIGCLPVVDGAGRLVGMLTDRDVCMAAFNQDERLSLLKVGDAMSIEVYTVNPGDGLDVVEQTMRAGQVRRLPVVDARGELRGILSLNDLVRAAVRARGGSVPGLGEGQLVQTLAVISEPAPPAPELFSREQAVNLGG